MFHLNLLRASFTQNLSDEKKLPNKSVNMKNYSESGSESTGDPFILFLVNSFHRNKNPELKLIITTNFNMV